MNSAHSDILTAECRAFTKYLIGQVPTDYVLSKYVQAHGVSPELNEPMNSFDGFLLDLTSAWPSTLGLVDPFTSALAKTAMVRKKLILLLSILETSSPSFIVFDTPDRGGKYGAAAAVLYQGALSVCGLCVATVILPPVYWGYRLARQVLGRPRPVRLSDPAVEESSSSSQPAPGPRDEVGVRVQPAEQIR